MLRIAASLLSCTMALAAAFAQSTSPEQRAPAAEALTNDAARFLTQCLQDWDKNTHMSKEQWTTACRRLAADREKYLREHPAAAPTR
jgi:hypothetical protein